MRRMACIGILLGVALLCTGHPVFALTAWTFTAAFWCSWLLLLFFTATVLSTLRAILQGLTWFAKEWQRSR